MATEIGDLNVIQDEDTLRRMWQQTEDFSRKKEIRLRMYRLREERLKSYYIARETTDGATVTDRKSTTSSHAESLNDRGFLTMKTKEIRDSASPTLDLKQICVANHPNANQSQHVGNESNQISISRYADNQPSPLIGESFSVLVRDDTKNENFEKSSHYTASSSSHWETSQKSSNVEYNEKLDKPFSNASATATATATATAKTAAASDYKTSKSNDATTNDHRVIENLSNKSYDQTDTHRETRENGTQIRTSNHSTSEQYVTEIGAPVRFQTTSSTNYTIEKNSQPVETTTVDGYKDTTRNDVSEVRSSKTTEEISRARSTTSGNLTRNLKTITNEDATNVNKSIMRELHKLDSYLSTEAVSGSVAPSSPSAYAADDRPTQSPKTDVDYTTTYQHAFTNKISQDVSATHNAFASSLRASPTPSSKRSSSKSSLERSSPEKTPRVSPEKCPTYVASDLSKKFTASFQNRISAKYEKKSDDFRRRTSTSECDSDDSSATYQKRDNASVSTTTRHHVSKTENRFRETERSSEGSVEREILNKYSKSKSPDSSPERSAFRAVSAVQAERFQTDIRRQSFPQTPDRSHQSTQKRKIQSEERSYSDRINVRQSPSKVDSEKTHKMDKYRRHDSDLNAKPNAARVKTTDSKVTETRARTSSPTKPKRVTSPVRCSADKTNRPFDDITEYTASYGSPPPRSRTQSPEKKPYGYTSIRSQPETNASPTTRNPIQITSTKIAPSYRASVPGTTKRQRTPSPIKQKQAADERNSVRSVPSGSNKSSSTSESRKADAHSPSHKNELRKCATSPAKTGSTKKPKPKKQLADKQSESESSESSSTSSSDESDTEGNQVTIEEITENHQLDTPSGGTLDELIKTDDEIKRVDSQTVDEFDFVKEEKTTPNKDKSTTNTVTSANEEFLRQEKLVKEGEIDGSIPPAEVVLGKEAAKLLQKDFIAKEKESTTTKTKTIDKKHKDKIFNEPLARKQIEKTKTKADVKKVDENEVTKTQVQTTNSKLPSQKEESPRRIGTTLDENNAKRLKQERERFEKDSRRRQSKSDLSPRNTERQLKNVDSSKSICKSSTTELRNTTLPQKPDSKMIGQEAKMTSFRKPEAILTKHKSDKDVYKKKEEVNKKYRRAETDRVVKTNTRTKTWPTDVPRTNAKTARSENIEADKYATARRSKQITVRSKTEAVEKKPVPAPAPAREFLYPNRHEKTPSKTLTKTLTKKASNVDVENDRKMKTSTTKTYKTVLAVTVPSTRHLSTTNQRNTVTIPVNDTYSRPATKRTPNEFGAKVESAKETVAKTRTSISGQIKSTTTPITSSRPRKDTPKPRQITINVRNKPGTTRPTVSSKPKDIKNEIFKTTSSSSSSSLDLVDVEEDAKTETIDLTKIHLKNTVTSPSVVDGQHLNVIVRMPSSSRETTPKLTAEDGFCTVTDDSDHPRYADRVTEPEDVESMKKMTVPRFEKITDLDEQDEGEETENVSVADRVTKFLENTKDTKETPPAKQTTVDQVFQNQAVHKTKEIFESIAKNSKPPPPVINRPSVFEQKRLSESIKEEEENAIDSNTLVGHDGQHKIVSKKLTLQDYEDYVAERESARSDKSTDEQREILSSKIDDDDFRSREKISSAETDSHRRFTKNFAENEREELEKESAIHEQIETNLVDVSKQKPTPDTGTTCVEKRKSVTKMSDERNHFEERSRKNDQNCRTQPKSPTRGTQPESKVTETSVVSEKQSLIKSQSKEIQLTRPDGKVETRAPSSLSSEAQPSAKSRQSSTRTKPSPKSADTSPTRKQTFQIDTVDNCDATRKIVQRYESRKSSNNVSLEPIEPIELTTVEVKPSKRIFDHTAITTVNAYDTQRTQQNIATRTSPSRVTESRDRPRNEKSPSPDKRKFDSSPGVGAKKLEKRLSTTAKDYQNRKEFFENRSQRETEKATRQRSDDHIEKTLKQRETSEQRVHSANRKSPQRKVEQRPASRKSSPEKDTNTRDKTFPRKSPEKLSKPTPFGVTLKKTISVTDSKPQRDICNGSDSEEMKNIEKMFDITLLETMLEKAVRYDVRSRIRAQIRLVRRQMELKKKSLTPSSSPEKSPVREITRASTSQSTYNNISETNQVSADRRDKVKKRLFTDQYTQRKIDDKVQSQQSRSTTNEDYTKFENTLKKQRNPQASENDKETTYRKDFCTSEAKSTTTRSIISGYGVGPTDENGKPLFGLKALRTSNGEKQSSTQAHYDKTASKSRDTKEITDNAGRPLFGLKALQRTQDTDKSASRTSPYSKTIANKYRSDSADDQFENYRGAQSRSSNDGNRTITTTNTTTTMYSSRTAMKSDGNGNVSILRDEVKGEIQANNGQEPTGKMTRNQLSYQKPRDSEAVVRTATTTRTLNSKNKENVNRNYGDSDTGEVSARQYTDDDNSKSKFLSSSLIRRISNEHFEKAHRKFSGDEGASETKRDSFEKSDSKHKLFSKTDSKESFTDNYGQDTDKHSEYSQYETSTFEQNDDNSHSKSQVARNNSFKEIKSKFQQATVSSSMKQVTKTSDEGESFSFGTKTDSTQRQGASGTVKNQSDLFHRRSENSNDFSFSKVNDRGSFTQSTNRESSSGTRSEFTDGEKEAVSLLNKFVSGSISLHELEVIPSSNERVVFSKKAALLDKKSENQNKTNQNIQEFDIDQIWDEERLRNLLEACTDYEKRRLIRARLRAIMAERKGCTDLISATTSDSGADITQTTNESTEVTETSSSVTTSKNESFSSCTKVHSKTSSSTSGHFIKANSVTSPFAKFRQLERQNSLPSSGAPIFKFTDPKLTRSASSIKDRLLNWVKAQTKDYKNIQIDNFSTSWNNGLAFCALIHHFCPHAFDYNKLTPEQRRYNFELAFRIAEQEAGIVPLLDVEDMVIMKRPDWKCVFTYVQSVYQRFHASPEANRP